MRVFKQGERTFLNLGCTRTFGGTLVKKIDVIQNFEKFTMNCLYISFDLKSKKMTLVV